MAKLILLAIVLFTSIVPIATSSASNPQRTVRRIQIWTCVVVVIWAYFCRSYYPTLVPVE